ncbi:universal stress protein [Streptomyces sp. CC77]|uniref:universal stress protein n=1 Tax=Streptomyces sp. CC77 TaxID=1906739 RepID=UPI0008DD1EDB|nr:universal stress protein [Streptomyces sp. CC77]OII70529.1 hypothetical protein BJP39_13100 [Streptomyces sp. CC77]
MTNTRSATRSGPHAVVAGLDGSPESAAAAAWAADEAALRNAPLHLVHALEERPAPGATEHAQRLLRVAVARAQRAHPGLTVATGTPTGRSTAAALASGTGPDGPAGLLVLGSRGRGALAGFLAGSVGLAVAGAARCPVVLVRRRGASHPQPDAAAAAGPGGAGTPVEQGGTGAPGRTPAASGDVVVGVDVFEPCGDLLAFAFEEAAVRGCALHALHCWSLPAAYGYAAAVDPDIRTQVARQVSGSLTDLLLPWRRKHPSVPVVARTVPGPAAAELVRAAEGAAMLVVGRRAARLPFGPRLGHVAHAVIHHAALPVAVVPHGE